MNLGYRGLCQSIKDITARAAEANNGHLWELQLDFVGIESGAGDCGVWIEEH
jgi:predicted secreted protein